MPQIVNAIKINVSAATVTGTTAVNSGIIDMKGFDGVLFVTTLGSPGADRSIKVQEDSAAAMGAAADLAGTSVVSGANATVWVDVWRPLKRYVRCVVTRTTTTTAGEIYAIQYAASAVPVVNVVASTIIGETWQSPAEGTA